MNREILRQLIIEALTDSEKDQLYSKRDDKKELKKAYRKLLVKYHPDRAGDSESEQADATETTQEINSIYDELSNKPDMTYNEPKGSKRTSSRQSSSDGFQWDMNPKMPSDFNDEELKKEIKDAKTVSGAYGFAELYVEFLRRQDRRLANIAVKKFNEVNKKEFSNLADITNPSNKLMGFKIKFGTEPKTQCSFDDIYKSLRMLEETSIILTKKGLGGLSEALERYKLGAYFSPLRITADGRNKISESIEAFEKIVKVMGIFKRIKYMWMGASKKEKNEMRNLINKVSSLNSVEGFHRTLYHLILK